ncbi:MAG: helix-turn-helix transcriptional regulator [Prolixibacteraceae bacterium]|nr:helix-turn-helix transcriptional regulator [Prolixibacteraceae bacterium]
MKTERIARHFTQDELARKIGVSRQSINSIENGRYIPSTVLSLKISEVFGKVVNDIFFLDKDD